MLRCENWRLSYHVGISTIRGHTRDASAYISHRPTKAVATLSPEQC